MLQRTKQALVESFVGCIALGWLFAQAISHFANIFSAPLARWLLRQEYTGMMKPAPFALADALPELIRCVVLLTLGYVLLRWLYFKPEVNEPVHAEQSSQP